MVAPRIFARLTPGTAANPIKLTIEWQKVVERLEQEVDRIGGTTETLTFNNSGAGGASGTTFNGSTARTISYNTVGASSSGHNHDATYQPIGSYLTGNQTITFSGDATGSGATAVALTIASGAVTYAKMQDVSAASKLIGRGDSGAGDPQEITLGSGLTMTGTTLSSSGGSGLADGDYGDVVVSASGTVIEFDTGVVTAFAKTILDDANAGAVRTTIGAQAAGSYLPDLGAAVFEDQKAANTAGGTSTSGSWLVRTLNTTVVNDVSGASLSSNQITLPAGTYEAEASCALFRSDRSRCRLQDVTNGVTLLLSEGILNAAAAFMVVWPKCLGRFTLAGTAVVELQYRVQAGVATSGLGIETNFGVTEVFSRVRLRRIL